MGTGSCGSILGMTCADPGAPDPRRDELSTRFPDLGLSTGM
jgi:hypothetical protein